MSVTIIEQMIGKSFHSVEVNSDRDEMTFDIYGDYKFTFLHHQDCCESVTIADIDGDLEDLERTPITMAEVVTESGDDGDGGSHTWTFFKFGTTKGTVTVRWNGESNGYYSENVSLLIKQYINF